MKLSLIAENYSLYNHLMCESGYGRTLSMRYLNYNVDPRPYVLLLGRWRHPNTGNLLCASINLNYLNNDQVTRLRTALPQILRDRNLKRRYWKAMELIPDIMDFAYRTYDENHVRAVKPSTLRYLRLPRPEAPPAITKPPGPVAPPVITKPPGPVTPPEPTMPPEEPGIPPETSQERRARERAEAGKKTAQRGTRGAMTAKEEPEEPIEEIPPIEEV